MLEMKLYDLYYSEKQKKAMEIGAKIKGENFWLPRATGANGEKIFYTERVEPGKGPYGKWDDYRFVGKAKMLG